MTHRYSLRFESGERRGEVVVVDDSPFSIGRAKDCSLRIVEASVSGRHAELVMDGGEIVLRDLGSTNGTSVGEDRILERPIRPGDRIRLGNVRLVLAEGAGVAGEEVPTEILDPGPGGRGGAGRDTALEVSPASLEAARRGSRLGRRSLGVLALLLVVAVAAGWWTATRGGVRRVKRLRPVPHLADNLLAEGFSFEGTFSPWQAGEQATSAFVISSRARYSGEKGIGVSLEAGEEAQHSSPTVAVRGGSVLVAGAALRATGEAAAWLGIELSSAAGGEAAPGPVVIWSPPHTHLEAFEAVELRLGVPGGYDRARVLLAAEARAGDGRVEADDVHLTPAGRAGAAASIDEYRVFTLERALNLFKVDHTLLSGLALRRADSDDGRSAVPLGIEIEPNGVRLRPELDGPGVLTLRAEPAILAGGLGTMGAGGYALRQEDFEGSGITDLLFGRGGDLVRLSFDQPATVRARREGAALRLRVQLPAGSTPLLQLRFRAEREAAINLAADAEAAEQRGDLGRCLSLWQELLDRYPFEERKVARAEAVHARLVRTGLEETRALSARLERARFFRLVDLYRQCRSSAQELAERYAGSEVSPAALELVRTIDGDLTTLEADLDRHEVQRLRSILTVLEASGSRGLADEVRDYLAAQYGVAPTEGGR